MDTLRANMTVLFLISLILVKETDAERGCNPAEKEDSSKDIEMDAKKEYETNLAHVLPNMCDNLIDLTELDRNNKSLFDTRDPDEKDTQSIEQACDKINVDNKDNVINNSTEEKLSKLEEVVEKVVEFYVTDSTIESSNDVFILTDKTYLTEDDNGANKNRTEHQTDEAELIKTKEAELTSVVSPSQSEDSRATRWEALADIAAELPPSLAVDPLTGQIYALSK